MGERKEEGSERGRRKDRNGLDGKGRRRKAEKKGGRRKEGVGGGREEEGGTEEKGGGREFHCHYSSQKTGGQLSLEESPGD